MDRRYPLDHCLRVGRIELVEFHLLLNPLAGILSNISL